MEKTLQPVKDASHLYEVERRARHAERPGFRINELQISPTQQVPWHFHSNIQDTFYVLEGSIRIFLREPKEEVRLNPGENYAVPPRRPHLVVNGGDSSATFLLLQGIGEYDFVPLV
jgi:quercetin dioxygenase-like cupin family protein